MDAKVHELQIISLPERISQILRDGILNGDWKPGQQIVESRVAREFGVSQNAVREALLDLESQGFVLKIPHKGTYVSEFSWDEIEQAYRVRMELESLAVKWAR